MTEEQVNGAVKFLTIYMIESKYPYMKADVFHDGNFYVVEVRIRKVEDELS